MSICRYIYWFSNYTTSWPFTTPFIYIFTTRDSKTGTAHVYHLRTVALQGIAQVIISRVCAFLFGPLPVPLRNRCLRVYICICTAARVSHCVAIYDGSRDSKCMYIHTHTYMECIYSARTFNYETLNNCVPPINLSAYVKRRNAVQLQLGWEVEKVVVCMAAREHFI